MRVENGTSRVWIGAAMALAVWASLAASARDEAGARHFVYVSDKRIVTLELPSGKNKAILNYINLDDVIELIQATGLLVLDSEGRAYSGHLIVNEQPDLEGGLYRVGDLMKPKQFQGYEILGNFDFRSPPQSAYLRLGSRIVRLEPLTGEEFEVEAAKIGRLDLAAEPRFALADAGFWRGLGDFYYPDAPEAGDLESKFPGAGPLPPVLVASPPPRLPSKWSGLPDPVVVRLRASVTAQGALVKLEVIDGVNPELDEQAMETVRNSWSFLPAIAGGEPANAELVLNVVFGRE